MSLKNVLMEDLKVAMREKDTVKKSVVTMLRAAIKQVEVDERRELDDADIIELAAKQVKQKNGAIVDFRNGDRQDLVEMTEKEIEYLMAYLPKQLTEAEIEALVDEAIRSLGAQSMKDMGRVMGHIADATKGRADGRFVADCVKRKLS